MARAPSSSPSRSFFASSLARFAALAFAGVVVFTLVWTRVSDWTSYPVGVLAGIGIEQVAPGWVRTVHNEVGTVTVDTSVAIADARTGGRLAEISVDSSAARYAYSLPIFLALVCAVRAPRRLVRALVGYLVLLPVQAFSLAMHLLMQVLLAAQLDLRVLKIAAWQMESIVFGYQVGVLVLPTLAPILVWLWLDRRFVQEVLIQAWRDSQQRPAAATATSSASSVPAAVAASAVPAVQEAAPGAAPHQAPMAQPATRQGPEISTSAAITLPERKA